MPNNLMDKVVNDREFSKYAAEDIRRLMDEEMSKPIEKRDYKKIAELSGAYCEIVGAEDVIQQASQAGIDKVIQMSKTIRRKPSRRITVMISAAISAAILAIANVATVAAWDMDVFTAIIHFTKDGFSVDFPEREAIVLPTSEDDPYGIKGECAKYGMEVEAPTYLPKEFVLEHVENEIQEDHAIRVGFYFCGNRKEKIQLFYTLFDERTVHTSIPSDKFNLSEISVNGKTAVVSKEDEQYSIIWADGKLETMMFTQSLSYDECDKIVASLK